MAVKRWLCDGEMANAKGEVIRIHPTEDGFEVRYTYKTEEDVDGFDTGVIKFRNGHIHIP